MFNSVDQYKFLEEDYKIEDYKTVSDFLTQHYQQNIKHVDSRAHEEKTVYIITGGIASGKSTFIYNMIQRFGLYQYPYIGTDSSFSLSRIENSADDTYNQARKNTDNTILSLINRGCSFVWETVLSKEKKFECIEEFRKRGYTIICIFLGTENEQIEINRHNKRKHNVRITVKNTFIRDRHIKNIYALRRLYRIVDFLFIFDSSNGIRLLAYMPGNRNIEYVTESPEWLFQSTEKHRKCYIPIEDKKNNYWIRGMSETPILQRKNPVVIIHGYFSANRIGPSRLFVEMAKKLADEGYVVYRFDLSGMGESDLEFEDVSFDGHKNDVLNIFKYVYERHNNNINVICHCIGCNIALSIIPNCRQWIANIILVSPFIWNGVTQSRFFSKSQLKELNETHQTVRKGLRVNDTFLNACSPKAFSQDFKYVIEESNITLSTILAKNDEYIPFEESNKVFSKFKPNENDLEVVKQADHNFHFGRNEFFHIVLKKMMNIDEYTDHRIILVRHGQSCKNIKGIQGGKGENLTTIGINQVNDVANHIKQITSSKLVHVYSPDREHTRESAAIIAETLNTIPETLDSMVPLNLGVFDGLSKDEMQIKYPSMYNLFMKWNNKEIDIKHLTIRDIESYEDYWHRGTKIINSISRTGDSVLVCTNSLMILLAHKLLGNDPINTDKYRHIDIPYCGMISFTTSDYSSFTLDKNVTNVSI